MAGDWIKIELVTPNKPEIDVLAELLDVSVNEIIGGLVRLWIWADTQTLDGDAASVTKNAIDRHSGVIGLADAMLSPRVQWLRERDGGGFSFPNFDRHNGQTAKTRALTAKRMATHRKRLCDAASVTRSSPEKRREEKKKTPLPPSIPDQLNTVEFTTAWASWEKHRREIKKPLTDEQSKKQLGKFAEWGVARSIAAINFTIEKGWQGIREPDSEQTAAAPSGNHRPRPMTKRELADWTP